MIQRTNFTRKLYYLPVKNAGSSTWHTLEWLHQHMYMFKIKIMCFHFFMLYKWTLFIKKFFTTHDCFGFYIIEFRKRKSIFCTSEVSLCFTQKCNLYIMNKSNWLECIQVYRQIIFLSKNIFYIYIYRSFYILIF